MATQTDLENAQAGIEMQQQWGMSVTDMTLKSTVDALQSLTTEVDVVSSSVGGAFAFFNG